MSNEEDFNYKDIIEEIRAINDESIVFSDKELINEINAFNDKSIIVSDKNIIEEIRAINDKSTVFSDKELIDEIPEGRSKESDRRERTINDKNIIVSDKEDVGKISSENIVIIKTAVEEINSVNSMENIDKEVISKNREFLNPAVKNIFNGFDKIYTTIDKKQDKTNYDVSLLNTIGTIKSIYDENPQPLIELLNLVI